MFCFGIHYNPPTGLRSGSKINISVKQNECLQLMQEAGQGEEQEIHQHVVKTKTSYVEGSGLPAYFCCGRKYGGLHRYLSNHSPKCVCRFGMYCLKSTGRRLNRLHSCPIETTGFDSLKDPSFFPLCWMTYFPRHHLVLFCFVLFSLSFSFSLWFGGELILQ